MDTVSRLANEFCRVLASWLTAEEIAEAVRLNASERNSGVCHSHDHCDANQAMLDAWEVVFGKGTVPACIREGATDDEINKDDAIWNSAWSMAKAREFKVLCVYPLNRCVATVHPMQQ